MKYIKSYRSKDLYEYRKYTHEISFKLRDRYDYKATKVLGLRGVTNHLGCRRDFVYVDCINDRRYEAHVLVIINQYKHQCEILGRLYKVSVDSRSNEPLYTIVKRFPDTTISTKYSEFSDMLDDKEGIDKDEIDSYYNVYSNLVTSKINKIVMQFMDTVKEFIDQEKENTHEN